jgi:hypothetical protein
MDYLCTISTDLHTLAGAVSVAWKPDNELKAIWVGASLPAIIATLVQTAPGFPKG